MILSGFIYSSVEQLPGWLLKEDSPILMKEIIVSLKTISLY